MTASGTYGVRTVDLDAEGRILEHTVRGPRPVPADRLEDHFAEELAPPGGATDLLVYVHGWQTKPDSALTAARRLLALAAQRHGSPSSPYARLAPWHPWLVLIRWPSRSLPSLRGYRRIRERAHAMSTQGHAAHVIGRLLGYLDTQRADPAVPPVLANQEGQYLHLVGHSFGCRFLCEAVQWAAGEEPLTLGWSTPRPHGRPFTVDSMLLFQMAAPRDAFAATFTALAEAPLRGPVVATYSQHDRATGFWHVRAERRAGIGHAGIGTAPVPVSSIRMLPPDEPYPLSALDHRFVSVDASDVFVRGAGPAGAHSDHLRPESAHLLLSLADHCR
ncbi:alpha/beta hydrolase [Streptomyces sp. AC550_RSS872]|uniref:alpha/beta hydrolase n=1 Tax=Streptomyces sp. AC550_RSS872 TaxID=2823689 RepID=UPI001C26A4FE|nr:alpha/beta hydrolase [Streptomyces sp. AC550_RSS872]